MTCWTDDLDVRRLRLQPGDVLVFRLREHAPSSAVARARDSIEAALARIGVPNRYLLLDAGIDLSVLTREEIDSRAV